MQNLSCIAVAGYFLLTGLCSAEYHTNTITTPGGVYAYSVDGGPPENPTINLVAGVTNILVIDAYPFHPVIILNAADFSFYSGAAPQDVYNGAITLNTPATGFPTSLFYMCSFHGFYGEIHLTAPSGGTPPPNTILQVQVGTNVVMTSTGTRTTWAIVPEFNSNLLSGAWSSVPNYTNIFLNGTNTTSFPRLEAICGPNVFLRLKQQPN